MPKTIEVTHGADVWLEDGIRVNQGDRRVVPDKIAEQLVDAGLVKIVADAKTKGDAAKAAAIAKAEEEAKAKAEADAAAEATAAGATTSD